ncbi:H-NS histone family protein [Roseobacter sp. HKCCD9010]|uniref:H-NS histone family protein n=1 Tax=Rhodobacterales TaxID=204455 RepID=UPI001491F795|nr:MULTISPECIES: H-NS histone family protein [Rhodobacterales]MBF9048998.1 H-NS histone family protein [Rhodobacterales bacterium HKCCD4356]NNV10998.1 H-NS histone family protein [Roseobacter sp. HKCCD7357]NNV15182.1 H-NS histone family protein [Roseobacter sp. HKCCD8768]NNV24642.1 H-NS histone family protein [Roseobacter sp. HKCCD8192]NNV28898.1 H-NS histone family protein [Roseobacter sp. HKCCD9061]
MAKNLNEMSRDELLELRRDVDAALKDVDKRKKKEALAAAQKAALEHGFSLEEVLGGKSGSGPKSLPKYANPADASQTWTGRGRQPGWIKDALAAGKSLDDMAI